MVLVWHYVSDKLYPDCTCMVKRSQISLRTWLYIFPQNSTFSKTTVLMRKEQRWWAQVITCRGSTVISPRCSLLRSLCLYSGGKLMMMAISALGVRWRRWIRSEMCCQVAWKCVSAEGLILQQKIRFLYKWTTLFNRTYSASALQTKEKKKRKLNSSQVTTKC